MTPKIPACFLLLALLITNVLLGCDSEPASLYEIVSPASLEIGAALPPITEAELLNISGNISVTNKDDVLVFDRPMLEQLGIVKYTVSDPWLDTDVTYSGVLVSELLKHAGVSDSVEAIRVLALDGYEKDIPMAVIQSHPVLLAFQADNTYLTVDSNGPTRIIFRYDHYSPITEARNMSVWNVASIEVQ